MHLLKLLNRESKSNQMCSLIRIRWRFIKGKKTEYTAPVQELPTSCHSVWALWSTSLESGGLVSFRHESRQSFTPRKHPDFGLNEIRCLDFQRTGIYSVTRPYCADSAYVIAEILRHQALSAEHCVDSVFLHQLVVSALFHHLSLIQNVDSIGISHG